MESSGGRARSRSVGATAAPVSPSVKYPSDSTNIINQEERRTLTVEYIVEQTFRTIAQMVVQARVKQVGEEGVLNEEASNWLNLKLDHSWQIDKELQRTLSKAKLRQIEGITVDLVIDIFADFTTKKGEGRGGERPKDKSGKELPPQVLLERWTLQFTSGANTDLKNIPTSINNKWTIVLLRSMYSLIRLLPAQKLVRLCKQQSTNFSMEYSLFSNPGVTSSAPYPSGPSSAPTSPRGLPPSTPSATSRRFDDERRPKDSPHTKGQSKEKEGSEKKPKSPTTLFSFGSVKSKTGTLAASVEYLNDISQFEQFKPQTIAPFVITDYIPSEPVKPVTAPNPKTQTPSVQKPASTAPNPSESNPRPLRTSKPVNEEPQRQGTQPPSKTQPQLQPQPQRKEPVQNPSTSPVLSPPPPSALNPVHTPPIPISKPLPILGGNLSPIASFPPEPIDLDLSPQDKKTLGTSPSLFRQAMPFYSSTPPAFSSTPPPFSGTPPFSSTPPFSAGSFGMYGSHYSTDHFPGLDGSSDLRNSKGIMSSPHSPFKEPTLQDVQLKQSRSFHEDGPIFAAYVPLSTSLPLDVDNLHLDGGAFAAREDTSDSSEVGRFVVACSQPQPLQIFSKTKPLVGGEKLEKYHQFINQIAQEIKKSLTENEAKAPPPPAPLRSFNDFKREGSLVFGEGFLTDEPFPFDEGEFGF